MLKLDNMDMDKIIIVLIIIIIIIVVLMLSVNKTISKPTTQAPTTQAPTTQAPTTISSIISHFITIKDFGAKGDGFNDDTECIKNAINAISADNAKIRTLFIPEGTYITTTIQLFNTENITIFGQNRNKTILKLDTIHSFDSATVIDLRNVNNITIKSLTIDGSKDAINQQVEDETREIVVGRDGPEPKGGGHGIRGGGDFQIGLVLDDIIIQNCHSYGLGFQTGNNSNFYINNFIVQNVGNDGIDFKNTLSLNNNINITNGIIRNFGNMVIGKPGIDVRGNFSISNIYIELNNTNNTGIRIRGGKDMGKGVINNINILGNELENTNITGIIVSQATPENLTFNNIYVKNATLANIYAIGGVFNNMVSENAPGESALNIGWGCDGRKPEDCNSGQNIIISNLQIKNPNGHGVRIRETAKNVIIDGFNISGINDSKKSIIIDDQASNISLSNGFIPTVNSIEGIAIENNILTSI